MEGTTDVAGLLQAADIGVLSTRSEGCPNSVLEHMLAGLPVVATAIPALHEVFDACDGACLFPVGDRDAFADRMRPPFA